MGFPSPATDYVEDRLTVDKLCDVDMNCRVIETSCGWAVINISLKPESGGVVLATYDGRNHFVRLMGGALDDVVVHGVVTHVINRTGFDDLPVI